MAHTDSICRPRADCQLNGESSRAIPIGDCGRDQRKAAAEEGECEAAILAASAPQAGRPQQSRPQFESGTGGQEEPGGHAALLAQRQQCAGAQQRRNQVQAQQRDGTHQRHEGDPEPERVHASSAGPQHDTESEVGQQQQRHEGGEETSLSLAGEQPRQMQQPQHRGRIFDHGLADREVPRDQVRGSGPVVGDVTLDVRLEP